MTEILTGETDKGWTALEQIMAHSCQADLSAIPPEWIRVLTEEEVAISFAAIDPERRMEYPNRAVRYGFLCAGATRDDLRRQGYFRRLLGDCCDDLREAGIPWLVARLPYPVGLRLGFEVFSHNSAFVLRPEEIEQTFGGGRPENADAMLAIDETPGIQEDLLVVTRERALDEFESVSALREAAWVARCSGKSRILFEHPPAPGPGLHYPIYPTRHTPLMVMAMTAGARVKVAGSEPEEDEDETQKERPLASKADMVKLLDLSLALEQALAAVGKPNGGYPTGAIALDTEAGQATIAVRPHGWKVSEGLAPGVAVAPLPAQAVAQLIIGYRSAKTSAYLHQKDLPPEAGEILDALFPRFWRFSRNESWVYGG